MNLRDRLFWEDQARRAGLHHLVDKKRKPQSAQQKDQRDLRIADHYRDGYSIRECAAHFGLSRSMIQDIMKRKFPQLIRPRFDTRSNSTGKSSRAVDR